MENNKRKIYVIGHKNPDTDSICSAIAYADIKNRTEENPVYEAKRAGQINEETLYVLKRFQMNTPGYMPNVGTRVKDMDVRKVGGVDSKISLKKAWTLMRNENVFTLPILNQNQELEGLITTNDITESYMDVYNNAALSEARTPYRNILETVDGTMIVGNEHAHFTDGKVLIAASSPEVMEQSVEQNDLVILGNRYEAQLCAIEMGASCIIVCMGVPISKTIRRLAEERECFVISSPHDTYTVARLINQSMPVKHFMTSENLVKFSIEYMDLITFILVIAAFVQLVEMVIKKYSPTLYKSLGIYLPLITTNCAVLGVALENISNGFTFSQMIVYSLGVPIGFTLVIFIFSTIRERLESAKTPAPFVGNPIALIVAGLMALAFSGLAGLV